MNSLTSNISSRKCVLIKGCRGGELCKTHYIRRTCGRGIREEDLRKRRRGSRKAGYSKTSYITARKFRENSHAANSYISQGHFSAARACSCPIIYRAACNLRCIWLTKLQKSTNTHTRSMLKYTFSTLRICAAVEN